MALVVFPIVRRCTVRAISRLSSRSAARLAVLAVIAAARPALPASPAVATPDAASVPMAYNYYPEVRLRKLHLVRPDLIPYPIVYEVYC